MSAAFNVGALGDPHGLWNVQEATRLPSWLSDDELTEHYRPASDVDDLVEAAGEIAADHQWHRVHSACPSAECSGPCPCPLCVALRKWRA